LFKEILHREQGFWLSSGPNSDTVLSSRVRLARNMKGLFFHSNLTRADTEEIWDICNSFAKDSCFEKRIKIVDLNNIGAGERRYLRERNLITYEMEVSDFSLVMINETDDFSIMVNDEDHFRIQVIRPGLQLEETWRLADKIDDELNRFVNYSFLREYGYLTSCPSNIGTGMKASVLLHLPVLTMKNSVASLKDKLKTAGAILSGTINNSDRTVGAIYQISNRVSLGLSEIDIIENVDSAINKLIELEDSARDRYLSESRIELEDRVWRSFGVLKYSRSLTYREAMEKLSDIRLGIILAIIKNYELSMINDIMVNIQWSHLQHYFNRIINSSEECDEFRAEFIRNNIEKVE
jgi:protein arginine kinase